MPTTSTPRKRAAKRAPAPAAAPVPKSVSDEAAELVKEFEQQDGVVSHKISKKDRKTVKMVTVFELDGREYQVPAKPSPALIIRYLREARKIGQAQAGLNALHGMLGEEAMDALAESPDVEDEDIAMIYKGVAKVFFDGMKGFGAAQGN